MNLPSKGFPGVGYLVLASVFGIFAATASAADNVLFSGLLIDQTCTLEPGAETQLLDFEEVSAQELYRHGRSRAKAIVLNLLDCTAGASRTRVKAVFSGQESPELPGFLLLSGTSPKGLVIGLETDTAQPLPLGALNSIGQISADGRQSVSFQAYLKALPSALASRGIGRGPLDASLTFTLSYD
ncbi:type 1 fimbrial protein [Pseudomonas sp. NFXW11]|uniref:fimbrial protein n=1 Tax=Pseudomonas sp. NFXW11 TaxID=2819531 RepID=UPI003CFA4472